MKKNLIALSLSLLTAQGLFAEMQDAPVLTQTRNTGSCATDCCKPCCTPKPRPCIDCECYVPAWNDMQCDWGLVLSVDFLYWYARESNLPYALKITREAGLVDTVDPANNTAVGYPDALQSLNTKWDPGVRVGLGWNTDCDGWDVYFKWTGYWNKKSDSSSVGEIVNLPNGESAFIGIWAFPNLPASINVFSQVAAKWDYKMNRFDLEFGRRYWLSKSFTLRPFVGLGGIWTETDFNVSSSAATSTMASFFGTAVTNQQNKNWGVGLIGGFEPTFQFSECFALYGSAGTSLLWGNQKYSVSATRNQVVSDSQTFDYSFTGGESTYGMLPMLDLGIGLRWETFWCERQYHFAFDLGWEHHTMFNLNLRRSVPLVVDVDGMGTNVPASVTFFSNDVNLGGLVLRARFDF